MVKEIIAISVREHIEQKWSLLRMLLDKNSVTANKAVKFAHEKRKRQREYCEKTSYSHIN